MARVDITYVNQTKSFVSIVDVSPPRDTSLNTLENLKGLNSDFLSIAYSPGKIPRIDSLIYAYLVKQRYGIDVIFSTATRDMNKLALGTRMMSASIMGLENAIALNGDSFSEKELGLQFPVYNQKSTELIFDANRLNSGFDNRGFKLPSSSSICIGGTINLNNDLDNELLLTQKKILSGASFFVTQPTFNFCNKEIFLSLYRKNFGYELKVPIFWGIQLLVKNGLRLAKVPKDIEAAIEAGENMLPYAITQMRSYIDSGAHGIYIVPPIFRGGRRDYDSAISLLSNFN
jgi:5,10-methylenetetrahydrofolate reductase